MKPIKKLLIVGIINCLWLTPALAAGGRAGEFLSWGAGARSLAMGKAYTAVADDATAGYWNPAAMLQLAQKEVSLLRANLWEGTVYDYFGFVYPSIVKGAFGLSYVRLTSGEAETRDEYNLKTGSFKDIQSAFIFSYSYRLMPKLNLGASLKKADFSLAGHTKGNIALDLSGLYKPFLSGKSRYLESLRVGWSLQNLAYIKTGQASDDKLPLGVRLGSALQLFNDNLLVGLDLENQFGELGWHFGGEYRFKYLALRLGIDQQEYSSGLGLNFKNYFLDYSYAAHSASGGLGGSQRVSMGYKFGSDVTQQRAKIADSLSQEAFVLIGEGELAGGRKKLNAVLKYSGDEKYFITKERLDAVIKIIPSATGSAKDRQELRKGIANYLKGEDQKALDQVVYAFSLNKADEQLYNLVNQIEKTTGLKAKQEEVAAGWNLVEQRLYKTLRYFRDRQFDLAVAECQEAIKLEPNNVLAFKRLGSAFYALGKRDKAKEAWQKVLKLAPDDPGNDKLRALMERIR